MKLFMIISACQCPAVVRVNAEIDRGSNTIFVSWTIPKPNCPATLSSVSPPGQGMEKADTQLENMMLAITTNTAASLEALR
jgi:hypothetical protein